jgi:hypothetical protein
VIKIIFDLFDTSHQGSLTEEQLAVLFRTVGSMFFFSARSETGAEPSCSVTDESKSDSVNRVAHFTSGLRVYAEQRKLVAARYNFGVAPPSLPTHVPTYKHLLSTWLLTFTLVVFARNNGSAPPAPPSDEVSVRDPVSFEHVSEVPFLLALLYPFSLF